MISISKDLKLPTSLRGELQKPLGRVVECSQVAELLRKEKRRVIAIGDSVSELLIKGGVSPVLIIWDGKTKRVALSDEHTSVLRTYAKAITIRNPPATITKEAWDAVSKALKSERASLFVKGEEDLLAIPAILNAEEGDMIVYGQPDEGAILIVIDRKIKALFKDILSKFD